MLPVTPKNKHHSETTVSQAVRAMQPFLPPLPSTHHEFLISDAVEKDDVITLEHLALENRLERSRAFCRHRPTQYNPAQAGSLNLLIDQAKRRGAWHCFQYLIRYSSPERLSSTMWTGRARELCDLELDIRKMITLGNALTDAGFQVEEGVIECFQ